MKLINTLIDAAFRCVQLAFVAFLAAAAVLGVVLATRPGLVIPGNHALAVMLCVSEAALAAVMTAMGVRDVRDS